MPNEQELIRARLGNLGLRRAREEEIIRELGNYVEDHAAELAASGVPSPGDVQQALDCVPDWPALRNQILSAETEEAAMNYRTKVVWLPALGALFLSSTPLAILQYAGYSPRFYFLSGGHYSFFTLYIPWLISLPIVGAVTALWSQRAGGKAIHRLLAALAPSIGLIGVFLGAFLISLVHTLLVALYVGLPIYNVAPPLVHDARTIVAIFAPLVSWVLLPAAGLLVGAAPFLRKHQTQS